MSRIGLGVFVGALALACASTQKAQKAQKANYRTFFYSYRNEVTQVSPGHTTGPYENRGVCVMNVGEKNEEAGVFAEAGTFDYEWAKASTCGSKSSWTCTFEDYSLYMGETTATCTPGSNMQLSFAADVVVTGGTGRFEGIQGKVVILNSRTVAPQPEIHYDIGNFQYTLPKK